jgi:hypothetical protein
VILVLTDFRRWAAKLGDWRVRITTRVLP